MLLENTIRYGTFAVAVVMSVMHYFCRERIKDFPLPASRVGSYYLKLLPVILILTSFYLAAAGSDQSDPFSAWKKVCLLSILWMVAYVDFRKNLIFNEYVLMGLILRGILLLAELSAGPAEALSRLISELLGSLILLVFGLLVRILTRKGVGMGDVKLFVLLPLYLGSPGALRAVLYSMLVVFVQACVCLLTKKKNKKDVLPFAPAILCGVSLFIIISGM